MNDKRRIIPYDAPQVDGPARGPCLGRLLRYDACCERPAVIRARAKHAGLASA